MSTTPILYYKADGNADDTMDNWPANLCGSLGFTTGKYDQAFNINNVQGDYVETVNTFTAITGNDQRTISLWVKPTAIDQGEMICWGANSNIRENYHFRFWLSKFMLWGHNDDLWWPASAVNLNEWNHIILVYNNSTYSCDLYLNGSLVSPQDGSFGGALATVASKLRVGSTLLGGIIPFQGAIDEVIIWQDFYPTQKQIDYLVNSESPFNPDAPFEDSISGVISPVIKPVLTNRRLYPYKRGTDDNIQLNMKLTVANAAGSESRLSYKPDVYTEVWYNYNNGTWVRKDSGVTNRFGIFESYHSASGVGAISNCQAKATVRIGTETYESNTVRINFIPSGVA